MCGGSGGGCDDGGFIGDDGGENDFIDHRLEGSRHRLTPPPNHHHRRCRRSRRQLMRDDQQFAVDTIIEIITFHRFTTSRQRRQEQPGSTSSSSQTKAVEATAAAAEASWLRMGKGSCFQQYFGHGRLRIFDDDIKNTNGRRRNNMKWNDFGSTLLLSNFDARPAKGGHMHSSISANASNNVVRRTINRTITIIAVLFLLLSSCCTTQCPIKFQRMVATAFVLQTGVSSNPTSRNRRHIGSRVQLLLPSSCSDTTGLESMRRGPIIGQGDVAGIFRNYQRALTRTSATTNTARLASNGRINERSNSSDNHTSSSSSLSPSSHELRHVAIICDGNARWAKQRGIPTQIGHLTGADRLVSLIEYLASSLLPSSSSSLPSSSSSTVEYCTLYGFSTENWQRPQREINEIFRVMELTAERMIQRKVLQNSNVQLRIIGDWNDERIPNPLQAKLKQLIACQPSDDSNNNDDDGKDENENSSNIDYDHHRDSRDRSSDRVQQEDKKKKLTINLAINYGGRSDIVQATRQIATAVSNGQLQPNEINESTIQSYLSTCTIPHPDMVIRTSGESRLSNFLSWESAYSELYFTDTLWPDFDIDAWQDAVGWYNQRQRRFGSRSKPNTTTAATTTKLKEEQQHPTPSSPSLSSL